MVIKHHMDKSQTCELNKSNRLITIIKSTLSYRLYDPKNLQEYVKYTIKQH